MSHKFIRIAGAYPPNLSRKVGSFGPLLRLGAVIALTMYPSRKKKICACLAWAAGVLPERPSIGIEAGRGTRGHLPRACFSYTPILPLPLYLETLP